MYYGIKSCILVNENKSDYFINHIGLRQGENLSPVLFNLFVNDLERYLLNEGNNPIKLDIEVFDNMLKILLLMYADDTVIISNNAQNLQKGLNDLHSYCVINKLKVNSSKTKIIILGRNSHKNKTKSFLYNKESIEMWKLLNTWVSYFKIMDTLICV
jgi:hypothetical protein